MLPNWKKNTTENAPIDLEGATRGRKNKKRNGDRRATHDFVPLIEERGILDQFLLKPGEVP